MDKKTLIFEDESPNPHTGKYSPHNLYFNVMHEYVNDGWIIYLDDDDYFADENSLQTIVDNINKVDDNTLIFWQFKLMNKLILPKNISKDNPPKLGGIGGSTITFNHKYKNIATWDSWKCSDYRIINNLYRKLKNNIFIKRVLIISPDTGSGNKIDIV
jgi:hypothetical protein